MRSVLAGGFAIVLAAHAWAQAQEHPKYDHAKAWFHETWIMAKSARIAITTGDLVRVDQELARARRQVSAAADLPMPEVGRATCQTAARAVVDFITAAKAGNMDSGPASFERQRARWDGLIEDCRKAVHAVWRTEAAQADR